MKKCDLNRAAAFLHADHYRLEDDDFVAHLNECAECRQYLESQAADPGLWASAAELLQPDEFDKAGDDACSTATVIGSTGGHPVAIQDVLDNLAPTDDPHKLGRLDHYEITGVVGVGGMGVVLKAVDPSLERVVAVKVMAPGLANNDKARKRFSREAKAAAAVLHPNVVPIHGVSSEGTMPFLVMPYIRGGSLQARLEKEGPLPLEDVLRIGSQIAAGLAAAHEKGLVHRDIKPENILLEEGVERVTITDFGLARAVDDNSVTQKGAIAGTPMYMSPEQARGEEINQLSDLFSLGSVLYALCSGRPPFTSDSSWAVMRQIIDETPAPLRDISPEIPEWMAGIVDRLMSKEAADRFATAGEVQTLLDGCLSHLRQPDAIALPEAATTVSPRTHKQATTKILQTGAILMSLIALVIVAVVAIQQSGTHSGTEDQTPAVTAPDRQPTAADRLEAIIDQWKQSPEDTADLEQQLRTLQQDLKTASLPDTEVARRDTAGFVALLWPHLQRPMPRSLGRVLAELTTPGTSVRLSDAMAKAGRPTEPVGWESQAAHALALGWAGTTQQALAENQTLENKIRTNVEKGRVPDLQLTFLGRMRSQQSVWKQIRLQQAMLHALAGDLTTATERSQQAATGKTEKTTADDVAEIQKTLLALSVVMKDATTQGEQSAALVGEWRVTYSEDSGRVTPQQALQNVRITFTKDSMITAALGQNTSAKYTLNATAQPAHIDITTLGRTQPGIYDLQGDTLRICISEASGDRPTAFDSQPDSVNDVVLILKRVREVGGTEVSMEERHAGPLKPTLARTLLPQAASISVADFKKLSTSPRPDTISNQSLSLVLMSLDVKEEEPDFVDDLQFAYNGVPKPSELVEAMSLSQADGYFSFIQPSYITDCHCQPAPDDASRSVGTVSFKSSVYKATVSFQAEKRDGRWVICQFHLPRRGITTQLTDNGQWRRTTDAADDSADSGTSENSDN